jgi:hypothetical protein
MAVGTAFAGTVLAAVGGGFWGALFAAAQAAVESPQAQRRIPARNARVGSSVFRR